MKNYLLLASLLLILQGCGSSSSTSNATQTIQKGELIFEIHATDNGAELKGFRVAN